MRKYYSRLATDKDAARSLSKCESPIEAQLVAELLKSPRLSKYVKTQLCVKSAKKSFRLDIVLMEGNRKLAVECDGKQFHSTPEQKRKDRNRSSLLRKAGWSVIRFTGSDIYKDVKKCVARVLRKWESMA